MYPADTGHNFVLADEKCNSAKSDFLASEEFLLQWQERNQNFNIIITDELSRMGFLTNIERSHSVASWAYRQAKEMNICYGYISQSIYINLEYLSMSS